MNKIDYKMYSVRRKLIIWYKKNGRDFPWRHTSDPYRIMVAEFMLHRTRAGQVVPVYNDFLKRFPDIVALSEAKTGDIQKYTETLGLHWRYKHFIESAKFIMEKYNGNFPDDYRLLSTIPGAGEYISCAISIIAFKKPAPVVDSNIARFLNRYYGLNLNGELRRKREIVKIAHEFFNCKYPDILLFGIVDFASAICRPGRPVCKDCPVKTGCKMLNEELEKLNNEARELE